MWIKKRVLKSQEFQRFSGPSRGIKKFKGLRFKNKINYDFLNKKKGFSRPHKSCFPWIKTWTLQKI